MMLPFVSPMEPSDLDAIMPLERQVFADPWTRRMYQSDLTNNPLAAYRVIRPATGSTLPPILAWGGFWLLVDEAHIATVAAHPEYRGCGLGQWLMVALMYEAQARGASVATLEVRASNLSAQRLYAKLGFDVVGTRRRYYRDSEDGLIMTTPKLSDPAIAALLQAADQDAHDHLKRCFQNEGQGPESRGFNEDE
jgi:ribosomal-protein-alanine N-acetyltransferase